jgi:O-antigen/teichoic acid export membrane protein
MFVNTALGTRLVAAGKLRWLIGAVTVVVVLHAALTLALVPRYGAVGAAAAAGLAETLNTILLAAGTRRRSA